MSYICDPTQVQSGSAKANPIPMLSKTGKDKGLGKMLSKTEKDLGIWLKETKQECTSI